MYDYDLFVSYRREGPGKKRLSTPWLRQVVPRIEHYLSMELPDREPRIFFDVESLEVGDRWPQSIRDALLRSKCLMPIWTPPYFRSQWCMAEWKSFLAREETVKNEAGHKCRLILPIAAQDGIHYPPEAQDTQQFDLRDYYATTKAFWRTPRADQLDQEIGRLAHKIAKAIQEAPEYREGWPITTPPPMPATRGMEMLRL